jgi:DNA-binding NarL/FixJ family response regulator
MSLPDPDVESPAPLPVAAVVDESLLFGSGLEGGLRRLGYTTRVFAGGTEVLGRIVEAAPVVVLVSLASTRFDADALIREIRKTLPNAGIVGYAGHLERQRLASGQAAGAHVVAPNSAMRGALDRVLDKLAKRQSGESADGWIEENDNP